MEDTRGAVFEIVIEPGRGAGAWARELWEYRELFFFLAWRDVLVRYKQTVIGVAWSVLRPFLTMLVFTVVFGRVARLPSDGVPYPVMVFAGMLPWQYFASAMQESAGSLIVEQGLVSKVYFPRIIVPTSSVIVSAVDSLISLALLGLLMLWYGVMPSARLLLMPAFFALATMAALGMGWWLSALNVKYRDFRYIVPFLVQFGLYVSPVGFSSSVVPERWRTVYGLDPMVGVIDGFRWCVQGSPLHLPSLAVSVVVSVMLFVSGAWWFRRTERQFADFI